MSHQDNVPELIDIEDTSDSSDNTMNTKNANSNLEGKVILESWKLPATYAPKAPNDKCSICHNLLTEKCATCLETSTNILDSECKVSMGQCCHAYHGHCIDKWIKDVKTCPIDQSPWIISTSDCSQSDWTKLVIQKRK